MNLQVLETVKTEYIKLRDKYQKKAIKEREKSKRCVCDGMWRKYKVKIK